MSGWPLIRNVLFAAAVLLAVATFVVYWTLRGHVSFSYYPKRMGVMVAFGVLAVCCAIGGILAAQRARHEGG